MRTHDNSSITDKWTLLSLLSFLSLLSRVPNTRHATETTVLQRSGTCRVLYPLPVSSSGHSTPSAPMRGVLYSAATRGGWSCPRSPRATCKVVRHFAHTGQRTSSTRRPVCLFQPCCFISRKSQVGKPRAFNDFSFSSAKLRWISRKPNSQGEGSHEK